MRTLRFPLVSLALFVAPLAVAQDVSLGPRASRARTAAGATPLVPLGSTWSYLDDGSNQGTAWRGVGFDDSLWATGPAELGYGDGDEATVVSFGANANDKHITTYYRHHFDVVDPAAFLGLELKLLRDDGAIVYLNGSQIVRSNMPNGTVGSNTVATSTTGGIEETRFYVHHPASSGLVAGDNVLAVEIHQRSATSSDTSLDLSLTGLATPDVARGPYLQLAKPTGTTVRWRTTIPTDARVRFGTTLGVLDQTVDDATVGTEHEVELTGLTPQTTYYYSVETSGEVLQDGPDLTFTTPPSTGVRAPFRAWLLGDAGTADGSQAAVRDAYRTYVGSDTADLILLLGDNAYEVGSDEEYQVALFDMYADDLTRSALWPARGNHEDRANAYLTMFSLPIAGEAGGVPSGTEWYYSFDHASVHFVCLDSDSQNRNVGGPMWSWLQADLQATRQDWIVAFWHHPPYTKGSHDSDIELNLVEMRQNFLPLLEDHGVDLVFSGHSHSYERSYLIDGHYGNSGTFGPAFVKDGGDGSPTGDGAYRKGSGAHRGAVYTVAGSSGKLSNGSLDHPAMFHSVLTLGSVLLDVDDDTVDVTFLDATGTVDDSFRIEKWLNGRLVTEIPRGDAGPVTLVVDGGLDNAGSPYVLVGAPQRTSTLSPAEWTVQASGVLDEVGTDEATLPVPEDLPPSLAGETLRYALLVLDPGGRVVDMSDVASVTLLP